jgi:hypothetical protein
MPSRIIDRLWTSQRKHRHKRTGNQYVFLADVFTVLGNPEPTEARVRLDLQETVSTNMLDGVQ